MIIENLIRENIRKLVPYTSARDTNLEGILLDANENGLGSALGEYDSINRYPDPNHRMIRKRLGEYLQRSDSNIFFGVGSDEIIDLLIRVFCRPGIDSVLYTVPSYGMYEVACDVNDIKKLEVELKDNFQLNTEAILSVVGVDTKIIFLCSPNNPTGNILNLDDIEYLCESSNAMIVVDEAYIDFNPEMTASNLLSKFNNLIILRTFSKAWGMAGLRCGYCLADEYIIDLLYRVKAPYNLNVLVQKLILEALNQSAAKEGMVSEIIKQRKLVEKELKVIKGVRHVYDSDANFILFKVDHPKKVYNDLKDKNIIIRDRSGMKNLEGCLRVTIGTPEENDLFINELRNSLCE